MYVFSTAPVTTFDCFKTSPTPATPTSRPAARGRR
jgi:hypothetical protein